MKTFYTVHYISYDYYEYEEFLGVISDISQLSSLLDKTGKTYLSGEGISVFNEKPEVMLEGDADSKDHIRLIKHEI